MLTGEVAVSHALERAQAGGVLKSLQIETVGAADARRHALESGSVMAVIADHLLPEVTHFVRPGVKIVLSAGPPRL
jgi:hypothetical protein